MVIVFLIYERFAQAQLVQYGFVSVAFDVLFQDRFAHHPGGHLLFERQIVCVRETAIVIHRRVNRQSVLPAQRVVLQPVSGRNVNKACARAAFHEGVPGKELAGPSAERMLIFDVLEMISIQAANNLIPVPAALFSDGGQQHGGNNERLCAHPNM